MSPDSRTPTYTINGGVECVETATHVIWRPVVFATPAEDPSQISTEIWRAPEPARDISDAWRIARAQAAAMRQELAPPNAELLADALLALLKDPSEEAKQLARSLLRRSGRKLP